MNVEAPVQVTPPPIFGDLKPAETQTPESAPTPAPAAPAALPVPDPAKPADGGGEKPTEPTTAAPEKPAEAARVVPERYDLKLPADSMMDQASLARIESYAKTNQLTQEEATALVQAQDADVKAYVAEKKTQWAKEVQNDRELGGEFLAKNVETARTFLDRHADVELRRELDRTGYGNHPGFMRFVLKLAKMSENDKAIMPGANQGVVERSLADAFYAETTSKKTN